MDLNFSLNQYLKNTSKYILKYVLKSDINNIILKKLNQRRINKINSL